VDLGDVVISDRVTKYTETPTPAGGSDPGDFDYAANTWKDTAVSSTYSNLTLDKRRAAVQMMIAPKLAADDSALFPEVKGSIYARNYGERLPHWGGSWVYGADAGLACLVLNNRRSISASSRGLRPAFIL
jgi:hypothetical protein